MFLKPRKVIRIQTRLAVAVTVAAVSLHLVQQPVNFVTGLGLKPDRVAP
jgi:hypothetical protein